MSDDTIQKGLNEMFEKLGISEEDYQKHISKTFSAEDIATITTILSLYAPLLEKSKLLQMEMLNNHAKGRIVLTEPEIRFMNSWIEEFAGLNESLRAHQTKEIFH